MEKTSMNEFYVTLTMAPIFNKWNRWDLFIVLTLQILGSDFLEQSLKEIEF